MPLTTLTSEHTTKLLMQFYSKNLFKLRIGKPTNNIDYFGISILKDNKYILGVSDPCNALELFILYVSFLFCISNITLSRRLIFIVFGTFLIYILNIIRCVFLAMLVIEKNWYVDIAHHYLFKLLMYFIIFSLWVWCIKTKDNTC